MIKNDQKCVFCGCTDHLTIHHCIPQVKCKNKYRELKHDDSNYLVVCESCHGKIHSLFDNTQLRDVYNTKDALMSDEGFRKFVEWKVKHPDFRGSSKMSNLRRR